MPALLAWLAAALVSLFSGPAPLDVGVSEPAAPAPEPAYANVTYAEPGIAFCPVGEPEAAAAPPPYRRTFQGSLGPTQPSLHFSFPVEDARASRVVVRVATPTGPLEEYHLAILDPAWRPLARATGSGDLAAEATQFPSFGPWRATLAATRAPPLPTDVTVEVLVEFAPEPRPAPDAWRFPAWAPAGVSAHGYELGVAGAQPRHVRVVAEGGDALRVTIRDTWGNDVVRSTASSVDVDLLPEWGPWPYLLVEDERALGGAYDVEVRA